MGDADDATWLVDNVHGNIPVTLTDPVTVRYGPLVPQDCTPTPNQPPRLQRERITQEPVSGEVAQWSGAYGWIVTDVPVPHPAVNKQAGKLYVHHSDLADGSLQLEVGTSIRCHVYADEKGLGAEQVSVCKAVMECVLPQ